MDMHFNPFAHLRRFARQKAMAISSRRIACMKHKVFHYQPASAVPEGKALVIAPHPDDEVFACGGLIARKVATRGCVDVLFMTKGGKSYDFIDHKQSIHIEQVRTRLAYDALKVLGLGSDHVHWQDLKDTEIPDASSKVFFYEADRLARKIADIRPEIMFIPHCLDVHQDHIRTYRLVAAARRIEPSIRPVDIYGYPTWMLHDQHPRDVVRRIKGKPFWINISSEKSLKREAIDLYLSATFDVDGEQKPYVGDLPLSFLSHFREPKEMFFAM